MFCFAERYLAQMGEPLRWVVSSGMVREMGLEYEPWLPHIFRKTLRSSNDLDSPQSYSWPVWELLPEHKSDMDAQFALLSLEKPELFKETTR